MIRYAVTLGAGHGGHDFGTVDAGGPAEKDAALLIARSVRRRLASTEAFDVTELRAGDEYLGTEARARRVQAAQSLFHLEIHAELGRPESRCAAVWHSAARPEDRAFALQLSRRLARALSAPDCGARVRYDFGGLFAALDGAEDYLALLDRLGEARSVRAFVCECGFPPGGPARLSERIEETAAAIAKTVCELFRVRPPRGAPTFHETLPPPFPGGRAVFLREGRFNLRAGPGARFAVLREIEGMICTVCTGEEGGWLRLAGPEPAWLSETAADAWLAAGGEEPPEQGTLRTTGRQNFAFVFAKPAAGREILGAVGGGTTFLTFPCGSFCRVCFGGRIGFIPADAFDPPSGPS